MRPRVSSSPLYLLTLQVLACAKIAHNLDILVEHPDEVPKFPQCYPDSDSSCSAYRDCCASGRQENPVLADSITCETVKLCTNGTCSRLQGQYSVHMVSRCPPSHQNSLLRSQCQTQAAEGSVISDKMSLPVYSNRTGLLYKNAHCALCHAETNDESLQFASSALACNTSSTCNPVAIVKSTWTHICYPGLVSTCQGAGAEDPMLAKACEQGPAKYEVCEGSAYRNSYCRLCRIGWYAPLCQDSNFPLWQLRSSLDSGGLMGVFVSFRPLRDNLPLGGFDTWGGNSTAAAPLSAVSLALCGTHAASIAGLTALLGVYIGLPALHNRPGFCLCSHAACALVLEILTVAARLLQPTHAPCLCILLASYFCLTGAFTWAAAFGVDLIRCLVTSLPTGAIGGSAKPLLALWLVPAGLAGILGGLNSRLGLWDLAVCQFAPCQKWVMLAVSLTPLSAALVFNFSLALAVHVVLRRRRRETSRVMTKSAAAAAAARQVGATLRVSVAMGAAWLPIFCLGNLPSSVGGDAKLLTAAVSAGEFVAALHGLVLAICFCCGRRVRQKLAARCA